MSTLDLTPAVTLHDEIRQIRQPVEGQRLRLDAATTEFARGQRTRTAIASAVVQRLRAIRSRLISQ